MSHRAIVLRGKPGATHHLIVDGSGIPLAYSTTPGNRHDVSQLWPLLDRIRPVAGRVGRPRSRPGTLYADRDYDYPIQRRRLTSRGIKHRIARTAFLWRVLSAALRRGQRVGRARRQRGKNA